MTVRYTVSISTQEDILRVVKDIGLNKPTVASWIPSLGASFGEGELRQAWDCAREYLISRNIYGTIHTELLCDIRPETVNSDRYR